ncbi:MAG: hypothetical protein RIQ89_229, partial [Bacteroidota bacterium]
RPDAFLFGEAQSRIVVTVSDDCLDDFMEEIEKANIDWANLGTVTAGEIIIDDESFGSISDYKTPYDHAIADAMQIKTNLA